MRIAEWINRENYLLASRDAKTQDLEYKNNDGFYLDRST
nr:MAG TPA: hypothetical protein [Bacteriophage sp.]